MELSTLIIFAVVVVLVSWWLGKRKHGKSLPGPLGLPIVGYLPFMTDKPHLKLTKLAKRYGGIYQLHLGMKTLVVITDYKLMKEAFAKDAFMGRPADFPFEASETTIRTGAFLDLPWKEQRRFSLHMLRDLGFGKTQMEGHLKEEALELMDRMTQYIDKPVKMSDLIAPSTSNNIASLLFGRRMKYNDPKRQNLDRVLNDIGQLAGAVTWQTFFPFVASLTRFFKIGNRGKLSKALDEVKQYCLEEVEVHESSLDANHVRDFVDGYLLEIKKKSVDPETGFQRDVLIDLARGFFGAGSGTVRIAVDWMLLLCAEFPDLQKKIVDEIHETLGRERFPSWQDRLSMPYTEAAICEMMRWKSNIPLNLMRYTLTDTELNGYFIPKHSEILAVFWAVDHNESLWGKDANEYRPERFLSEDGKKVVKPEYFIPFSTGKRSCPGKALAEIEIFLYVVALLQKFEFSMPPGKKADLEGILGIGLEPRRQEVCLKLRQ